MDQSRNYGYVYYYCGDVKHEHYIDDHFNVYKAEDILNGIRNPNIIAKWKQNGEQKELLN